MFLKMNLGAALFASIMSLASAAFAGDCPSGEFKQDNKCYKIGVQCSDYNGTNDKVCNTSNDKIKCDWDKNKNICFAPSNNNNNSGDCKTGEFKQDNKCYKIGAQCSEYNNTNDKVCNNSQDKIGCDWDGSRKVCFPEGPKDNGNKNPTPSLGMDDAANLLLSAPETQEMMSYKTSSSFDGAPVTLPKSKYDKGKNEATYSFPPAPYEQTGLQRTMNLTVPQMLTAITDPQNSSVVNTFTSRYATANLGFDYRVFTVKGTNIVHQADAKAYADATVLSYRSSIFDARMSGSYDAGPSANIRSDDYYQWRVRLDVLGKNEYFKSNSGPITVNFNEPIPSFLPDRKVLFETPTWRFVIAGLPMQAKVVPYGEYGMKDMGAVGNPNNFTITVSGKPFAGLIASFQVGPALDDINRWAESLGGIIGTIQAYLGIDLTVLRQTLNVYGTIGMRDPNALPLKAYMCRGANYDSLESLDGRIYAHAQMGIFTKVIVTYTKKVCNLFGNCLGFGDQVQELVQKYTTLVYDHDFFNWDGKKWPQSKKPIDQACTEYTI